MRKMLSGLSPIQPRAADRMPDLTASLRRRHLLIVALSAPALRASEASLERHVRVTLTSAETERSFDDEITAYEAVLYTVALRGGQRLELSLISSNAANCFDIHAPGIEKPVFSGADSGNSHTLTAPADGDYVIRVYLLRFAARDGQSARFTLEMRHET